MSILIFTQTRKYPVPWPISDVPWGNTPRLYDCGLDPLNQPGPTIITWGGRSVIIYEKACEVLLTFQVFDVNGKTIEQKVSIGLS